MVGDVYVFSLRQTLSEILWPLAERISGKEKKRGTITLTKNGKNVSLNHCLTVHIRCTQLLHYKIN